ncbi:MAG TPA: L-seryl-tRNA(Sec) selenium transferase, partial [Burkholderiales bacterium]|nr:L-seryl-tRNA(Sec) selenium transferase [Burkholderiales bacterium]
MLTPTPAARRALPSVDRLLSSSAVTPLIARFGRALTTETIRDLLQTQREKLAHNADAFDFDEARFIQACDAELHKRMQPSLRPVFNLTGTVLHTNLGRALMPQSVADAVMTAMTRPVNLEFDLGGGARGER